MTTSEQTTIVSLRWVAVTLPERLYALVAFTLLGISTAVLGRAGATFKVGKKISITITHEGDL